MKEKNLGITVLLDYYGGILTDKQRDVLDYYYNEDMSLAEIAEHSMITRQGVRDSIKRGEAVLLEMEDKLGLVRRIGALERALEDMVELASEQLHARSVGSQGDVYATLGKIREIGGLAADSPKP